MKLFARAGPRGTQIAAFLRVRAIILLPGFASVFSPKSEAVIDLRTTIRILGFLVVLVSPVLVFAGSVPAAPGSGTATVSPLTATWTSWAPGGTVTGPGPQPASTPAIRSGNTTALNGGAMARWFITTGISNGGSGGQSVAGPSEPAH